MNFLSFLFFSFSFITTPRSAVAQWMAIKCIPEVQAWKWSRNVFAKFGEVGSTHRVPRTVRSKCPPPKKNARRKRAKLSITQPWIIRFCSYFVCCKSSRARGQRSRSQRDITYQHQENAIIQEPISCRRSNLVTVIPELCTTSNTCSRPLGQILKLQ